MSEGRANDPAVSLRGITVRCGPDRSIWANRGVSLDAAAGEVHAVVGENGAGKTTLMRALYGLVQVDAGEVQVRGDRVTRPSPAESIRRGVGMVHQHFMLVDTLTVAENVVLGQEPLGAGNGFFASLRRRLGVLDRAAAEREVAALAVRHEFADEMAALAFAARRVGDLSVGEQQRVEILKMLYRGARILILDEPTAVLGPHEVEQLFEVLRALRDAGGTVLLVTHKLDEVAAIADRVTVLRRGEVVARFARGEAGPDEIAQAMVGRALAGPVRDRGHQETAGAERPVRLALRDVCVEGRGRLALDGVTLDVREGEILGVAGVEGNGQAELAAAIVGLRRIDRGSVLLDGKEVTDLAPAARRGLGLGFVPEDRHRQGLLLDFPVTENLLLGREDAVARHGLIDKARLDEDARGMLDAFDVRPADPSVPARTLSGGNQQKVLIARELSRRPRVLVCAQPTRGVDIGAIERIHRELDGARRAGAAILLVSAELDELLALADRITVMYRGRALATIPRAEATRERLGALMMGLASDDNPARPDRGEGASA